MTVSGVSPTVSSTSVSGIPSSQAAEGYANLETQVTAQGPENVTQQDRTEFLKSLAEQKEKISKIEDANQKAIASQLFRFSPSQRDAAIKELKKSDPPQITHETEMMLRIEDLKEVDRSNDLVTKLAGIAKKTASTAYEKQQASSKFNKGGGGSTASEAPKKSNLSEQAQKSLNDLQKIKEQGKNHITDEDLKNLNISPQVGAELQEYLLTQKESNIVNLANIKNVPEGIRTQIQTLFETSPPDYPAIMAVLQKNGLSAPSLSSTTTSVQAPLSSSDFQAHLAPQAAPLKIPNIGGVTGGNIQYSIPPTTGGATPAA